MVKEFDDIVQTAEIGVPVGPVKTQFGYHLILVDNRDQTVPSFEAVKKQVRQQYGLLKQQEVYINKMNELKKLYKVEKFQ